jgi:Tol biopolymer transport system component/DNA-binding winged helix-turn-helix (wHTH) protein
MVMRKPIKHLYEFGSFSLDVSERLLTCEGRIIPLAPKVFDTLQVLVENSGHLLEKEILLEKLWPDTVVEEGNLTTYISQLRKALGENGNSQSYIETVPRRGYRFVAEVKEISPLSAPEFSASELEIESEIVHPVSFLQEAIPLKPSIVAPPTSAKFFGAKFKFYLLPIFLLTALGASWFIGKKVFPAKNSSPFQDISISRLTTNGRVPMAAISPDGKYVSYIVKDGAHESLWLRQTATTSNVQIIPPAETMFLRPTFSPDGTQIYFVVYESSFVEGATKIGVLYRIPSLGGTPNKILEDIDSHIAISPDGKKISFIRNFPAEKECALMIANTDGSEIRKLTTRKFPENFSMPDGPSWSPDGKTIACAIFNRVAEESYFRVAGYNVESGAETIFNEQKWHWMGQISWLEDGSGLIVNAWDVRSKAISDQIWFVPNSKGEVRKITNDINNYHGLSLASNVISLVTVQSTRLSRIWILPDGDSSKATAITSGIGDSYSEFLGLAFTPAGKIVYGTQASGNSDIWVMDADGKNQRQLTTEPHSDLSPSLSRDGNVVVYSSYRDGVPHVWKMNPDGSDPQQITKGRGETEAIITPDGQWILYSEEGQEAKTLWKIQLDGASAPVQITGQAASAAAVSPDGKLIACLLVDSEVKRKKLAILSFEDGHVIQYFELKNLPKYNQLRWMPDGQAISFISTNNGVGNIWKQPINGGNAQQITNYQDDLIYRFSWSADGKQLAIERGMTVNDIILIQNEGSDQYRDR